MWKDALVDQIAHLGRVPLQTEYLATGRLQGHINTWKVITKRVLRWIPRGNPNKV